MERRVSKGRDKTTRLKLSSLLPDEDCINRLLSNTTMTRHPFLPTGAERLEAPVDKLIRSPYNVHIMRERDKILDETVSIFEKVVNKIHMMERIPKDFGTGELLHLGQINTIVAVGENPRISVTELSNQLGITKASASEMARKLEKKGYLKRTRDLSDGRSVLLEVTSKGQGICERHEKLHRENLSKYFEDITFGQAAIFKEILAKIDAYADMKTRKDA